MVHHAHYVEGDFSLSDLESFQKPGSYSFPRVHLIRKDSNKRILRSYDNKIRRIMIMIMIIALFPENIFIKWQFDLIGF